VFGGIAGLALLTGALAFSHHSSGHRTLRPASSNETTVTLPSGLQAPFDRLQRAVEK
jgi:hypothetical protein